MKRYRLRPLFVVIALLAGTLQLSAAAEARRSAPGSDLCDRKPQHKKCRQVTRNVSIEVLSNRADLVSGGDALVEITSNPGSPEDLAIALNGIDITSSFATRPNGRFMGVVTGLVEGDNDLVATASNGGARLTITNHPIEGPIFSGPQLQPWVCTTASNGLGEPTDDQCNAPTKVEYFYQAEGSTSFAPYDPENPPTDVAFGHDRPGQHRPLHHSSGDRHAEPRHLPPRRALRPVEAVGTLGVARRDGTTSSTTRSVRAAERSIRNRARRTCRTTTHCREASWSQRRHSTSSRTTATPCFRRSR